MRNKINQHLNCGLTKSFVISPWKEQLVPLFPTLCPLFWPGFLELPLVVWVFLLIGEHQQSIYLPRLLISNLSHLYTCCLI